MLARKYDNYAWEEIEYERPVERVRKVRKVDYRLVRRRAAVLVLLVMAVYFTAVARSESLVRTGDALVALKQQEATLLLKNLVFTTLVVVMLYKVRKQWTLLLFTTVNMLISLILLGGSVTLIPTAFAAALLGEGAMRLAGGPKSRFGVFAGVGVSDFAAKVLSLGVSFLFARETPALVWMVVPFVAIGYIGSFAGLFTGARVVKELRHAGIIQS